jgi:guanine nucleotide-binding protein subunit alpha
MSSVTAECEEIMAQDSSGTIDLAVKDAIAKVWATESAQAAKKRESEFHLLDSAPYFLDKVQDYFTDGFMPTQQDILRTRLTTTGIIETSFMLEETVFKMYDVGGQRGERKKWIHCFDDVTAIMFIASLSEYNQVLAEDRSRNRLTESLDLFEGIANLPWFEKASIVLFLNKDDLFREKVLVHDIGDYHDEYKGGLDYAAGLEFIQDEYFDRNENEDKVFFCHVTNGTDTSNVNVVWNAVQHTILESKLSASGLQM